MKKDTILKRTLSVLLGITMIMPLSSCGNSGNSSVASSLEVSQNTVASDTVEAPSQTLDGSNNQMVQNGGKILIVYFAVAENSDVDAIASASVTTVNGEPKGRVRVLADMIQSETGGDLFSIQTSEKYPGDGTALVDFAAEEQENNARPDLNSHIENLEEYDTIFIGYPNWWYDMPMVMYSFFDEYDFSGKTIIPFNVHNGSRFSGTIETITDLEPNVTVVSA